MKAKITKRLVDEVRASDKPVVIFDANLKGFVLKVSPGGSRVYQVRYRMGGRTTPLRTYTLGKHGPLTPDLARRIAMTVLGDVRRGVDPAAEKAKNASEERGALTIESLSAEFIDRHAKAKLKARSASEYERLFRSFVVPRIGALKVRDVTHGDIERLHHGLRQLPTTANRVVALLSSFFSWTIRNGFRPDRQNPVKGLKKFKEEKRKRYLSPAEMTRLGHAIRSCETDGIIDQWQADFFRCLLLTGLRRDELRKLEWTFVDVGARLLRIPDTKTNEPRDVPISGPVFKILSEIPRLHGNPFVFPGQKPGRPLVNVTKPWKRALTASGIEPARVHDLRHSAASVGIAAGASLALVGGVLGHKSQQTTQRYAHLSDEPVRATSEAIAERIAKALNGEVES